SAGCQISVMGYTLKLCAYYVMRTRAFFRNTTLTPEGIVRGKDAFLYGEKVKAYLRRGAKPIAGFTEYPNEAVGYGALCVSESLPMR
ncbi:MAG: hypothetical protein Q4B72_15830, partial [Lachnospiraceae bacterium]|nr:hypothetical protein [Lachnospiraceae bacterium]